jgi:hypothetical protein
MTSSDRFLAQLDACCRQKPPVRPLTGIDNQRIEEEEAHSMYEELKALEGSNGSL